MKFVFFGFGYCAEFLLNFIPDYWEIIGTHTKLPYKFKFKDYKNVKRYEFDNFLINKEILIKDTTHILLSIPPNENGDLVYLNLRNILKKEKKLRWLGYLSTTGVYGDHKGRWVDENSKLLTKNVRSKNRILSEKQYLSLYLKDNLPIHIFRLPGIYGPKRSILNRLKSGNVQIIKKKKHFFSRIHVEDIASCLFKSIEQPTPGEIFNITDDYPSSSEEMTLYAAKLLGKPTPTQIELDSSEIGEMVKSFYLENKKVSNKKVKKLLDWKPKYKNFKLGLNSIINHDKE